MKYRVIIEKDKNGFYASKTTNLPGSVSQGSTRTEAFKILKKLSRYIWKALQHMMNQFHHQENNTCNYQRIEAKC